MIEGIKSTLADIDDFQFVAHANNGSEVLNILESLTADVILMDINMPILDGLECTKVISEKYPSVKVIALSQFGETRFVKRMIKNGAMGYLLKDALREELIEAIRLVYAGERYIDKKLQIKCPTVLINSSPRKNELPKLTKREIEVLTLICNEFSSQEIADHLSISYNTVEHHRANLNEKSGSKNTAGLVRWSIENNLIP